MGSTKKPVPRVNPVQTSMGHWSSGRGSSSNLVNSGSDLDDDGDGFNLADLNKAIEDSKKQAQGQGSSQGGKKGKKGKKQKQLLFHIGM
ncbi:unnamed protein product [Ambrosiozyma monospora]|uniref:Unnamed protein product n=1 Tax=Ambrosiozyma monospora TaxID=43982 RepID=A0ACB5TKZ0_AMBMO|nr:unnamed protein product [Ambrosiozyma monospora]